jgi:hypothetical protein
MPETAANDLHAPLVLVPSGHSNPRGLLTRDLHLIFPFGLLMIGLRFVVRLLLVVMGRASADGDPHAIANLTSQSDGEPRVAETGT